MKGFLKKVMLGLFALSLTTAAIGAGDQGTAEEAVAMVKKAVVYMKKNGNEKAYAEFNNAKGQFIDRDLYIMIYDATGKNMAHGMNAKLIGKNLIDIKDAEGKLIVKEFIEVAKSKGSGWVDYKWANPVTKAIEQKSTYVEKSGDMIVGSGIYKK
jgi:signal transduction histidine kinase